MQLFSAFLAGWVQPADVFVQLYSAEENAFWLDGEFSSDSRYSILGSGKLAGISSLNQAGEILATMTSSEQNFPFAWRPGLVGWLTYEGEPRFLQVDRGLVFDHDKQGVYFLGQFESQEHFDFWHHAALLRLGFSGGQVATYLHEKNHDAVPAAATVRHEGDTYLRLIKQAQAHIAVGDVYQVCLTNEIRVLSDSEPLATFLSLRDRNPAPYSAFVKIEGTTLVSSSPEQFIQVKNSGEISSKPIKGTRRRGIEDSEDQRIAEELRHDHKERAENLMIVDLMRNDIGRVAEVGSVSVPKLFDVETYATVHQLVSTVAGQLAAGEDAFSAVASAFPGGSMTGAPKIRAMEIISELEGGRRGIYSGCVGYFGGDGSAEFAMVIRSLVFEDGVVSIGVGGGITIDSDPAAELAETQLKAKALLEALNATDPWA
ncbi:MAG: aminodeoxychorismate synthase component I [Rhodoluna sp.]